MEKTLFAISHMNRWLIVFLIIIGVSGGSMAHPMPNSVVLLKLKSDHINLEMQIPLSELQAAIDSPVNDSSAGLVGRFGPELRTYLLKHVRPKTPDGRPWHVTIGALTVHETKNPINGVYKELTAQIKLVPPSGAEIRHFIFDYDVILHQVVTHKILVAVSEDWATGQLEEETPVQVVVIELDIVNNRILPLEINLEAGNIWKGFIAMVSLGKRHIAEGTDHLLFLLVLLLPAPLLHSHKHWGGFGGIGYSLSRLLWIVSAFTFGHSVTLLFGSLGWIKLPGQPVEILIALSIFVSAVHAIRPLFPGRETWIAAGFGLIHGLAFANTLANLSLDTTRMTLSILGFNIGIELMQLVVIAMTIPWLILLSKTPYYGFVRCAGALFAAAAAVAWTTERVTGRANSWAAAVERIAVYAPYELCVLALVAIYFTFRASQNRKSES